jgi:autotransporter-associated beta strand protein
MIVGNLTPTGTVELEVNPPATTAGMDYDQFIVTGTVDLSAATLAFSGAAGAVAANQVVTLVANDAADATTASGTPAQGSTVTINGNNYTIFYNGGDGNDVVLVKQAAPTTVYVDDAFDDPDGTIIGDADPVAGGSQPAVIGVNAFALPNAGIAAVTATGTVIVNAGNYSSQAVVINKQLTMTVQEGASSFGSLDDSVTNAQLNLSGVALTSGANGSNTQFDSQIVGSGSLVKVGAGNLTLANASNSYSGGTTINAGTVSFTDNLHLGAVGSTVTIDGGTLNDANTSTQVTWTHPTVIGSSGGTLHLSGTGTPTAGKLNINSNLISGSGTLTKTGGSVLKLSVAQSFSGNWIVDGGVVEVGNSGSLGSGSVTLNNTAELTVTAGQTVANNLTLNTGSSLSPLGAGTATYSGPINAAGNFTVKTRDFWQSAAGRTLTISGQISGGGNMTVSSAGATSAGT